MFAIKVVGKNLQRSEVCGSKQIFVHIDEDFAIYIIQPNFLLTGKYRRGAAERDRLKRILTSGEYTVIQLLCIANYPSPLILTALFQHNLINVSYLTACNLYQVMMTLYFLYDVAESTQRSNLRHNR